MSLLQRKIYNKIFDSEHIVDKEATMFHYELNIDQKLKFTFGLWPYDQQAFLSLKAKDSNISIFDISISSLSNINYHENILFFYKENTIKPIVKITIKPYFSLSLCI